MSLFYVYLGLSHIFVWLFVRSICRNGSKIPPIQCKLKWHLGTFPNHHRFDFNQFLTLMKASGLRSVPKVIVTWCIYSGVGSRSWFMGPLRPGLERFSEVNRLAVRNKKRSNGAGDFINRMGVVILDSVEKNILYCEG